MSYIGTWSFDDNVLVCKQMSKNEGMLVNHIIYPTVNIHMISNCVLYDVYTACYLLMLTGEQFADADLVKTLIQKFGLQPGSADFVVNGKYYNY